MRIIFLMSILILLVTNTAGAFGGYMEINYNFFDEEESNCPIRSTAVLHVWKDFDDWRVGGEFTVLLDSLSWKGVVPSGIPYAQTYKGYIEYKISNLTVGFNSWCTHWFEQSGFLSFAKDKVGLNASIKYEF